MQFSVAQAVTVTVIVTRRMSCGTIQIWSFSRRKITSPYLPVSYCDTCKIAITSTAAPTCTVGMPAVIQALCAHA
eukprot:11787635-Ditylum_brightwellii.AAC.1